jgi:phage gp29-like protein
MAQRPKPYSSAVRRGPGRAIVPAELGNIIATTHDGRDITRPYVGELHEFNDRRLLGAVDWGEYDRILLDDQVKSCLTQRIGAVVSREWDVLPGDPEDPRSVAAGDALKANLEDIGWDRVTEKMLYAPFHGFAVAELMWGLRPDGLLGFVPAGRTRAIHVRHARRFRQDKDGRLRLITATNMTGEILPERKFWEVTVGATDDDQPYGRGLAEWLYWPCLFKRNGIRFWNTFLDKFSVPTAKGTYRPGTPEQDIQRLLSALSSIANDTGFVIPEGMAVELLHVATTGIDFEKMPAFMDAAIAKIILGQTMTNTAGPTGLGSGLADVQAGVKLEVITSDADLLTDSFSSGPARWWTDLNFGVDVAAPRVVRLVEEEEDTKTVAEADAAIESLGWTRTDESFRDTYGDGFERKAAPAEPDLGLTPDQPGVDPGKSGNVVQLRDRREASFAAPDRRPLYVHRRLKNAKALIAWAKKQGFGSTVPPSDMHVTVCYSKRPVDWFGMGHAWSGAADGSLTVPPGGPRQVHRFDKGAVVLLFASPELQWRHEEMVEKGASHDFADYRPHVTITYDAAGVDPDKVEPYDGELVFGPEIFEALDEGWSDNLTEVSFAESLGGDIVDQAVEQIMADEGWRTGVLEPFAGPLLAELARAGSEEEVRAILSRAAELDDEGALVTSLERAGFAVRMAATAGQDGEA